MATENKSYRCSSCDINWPMASNYETCPYCEGETWPYSEKGILPSEAKAEVDAHRERVRKSLAAHAEFERYYAAREVEALRAELSTW